MTTPSEPVCDPDSGICTFPATNEKTAPPLLSINLCTLPILRDANVNTLNNDKGDPLPIDSLKPTPLTLLYFSAVLPLPLSLLIVVMVSSLPFLHTQTRQLPQIPVQHSLHPRFM
jgi:hypothetical protein